jgi:hypothetical protein
LKSTDKVVFSANKQTMNVLGVFACEFEWRDRKATEDCYVVENPCNVFGLAGVEALKLDEVPLKEIFDASSVEDTYPSVFEPCVEQSNGQTGDRVEQSQKEAMKLKEGGGRVLNKQFTMNHRTSCLNVRLVNIKEKDTSAKLVGKGSRTGLDRDAPQEVFELRDRCLRKAECYTRRICAKDRVCKTVDKVWAARDLGQEFTMKNDKTRTTRTPRSSHLSPRVEVRGGGVIV